MANFSESLTVRILGDSTQLQRELDAVQKRLADLRSRFSQFEEINRGIGQTAQRVGELVRPLGHVSRLFDRVANQARGLGRIPIMLNVGPAISALRALIGMLNAVAAKMRALSPGSPILGFGPGLPVPAPRSIPRLNGGGLVRGTLGSDRVPAMLTAGEFVLRQPAVRQLGVAMLNQLNQNPQRAVRDPRPNAPHSPVDANTTVNNFGGISIRVSRPVDVNAIVRDLRWHGFRLRNRRG